MEAFLEPHRSWIESVVGCPKPETVILEMDFPLSQLATAELLQGVVLDRQCLESAASLRSVVSRWQLPPGASPRIEIHPGRDRTSSLMPRNAAWDPHWKDTPVAIWLRDLEHAVVSANIPYVSYIERGALSWRHWILVNRAEVAPVLNLLRTIELPRRITTIGGRDLPLDDKEYNWDSVVLDPCLNRLVREDFEAFFEREAWFLARGLPYRRGYLLYGPPGNGKTAVARIMARHPAVHAFAIDFSDDMLPNAALTELFQAAGDCAPSLVIMEDLDRVFFDDPTRCRTRVTLQHLLGCLDGFGSRDGVVVVATANDPARLDPALLRRPGRFDRVAPFPPPSLALRQAYLERLGRGGLDAVAVAEAAVQADRLSFAQVREAYILAGQRAFERDGEIGLEDLLVGLKRVRSEGGEFLAREIGREVGFGTVERTVELPA